VNSHISKAHGMCGMLSEIKVKALFRTFLTIIADNVRAFSKIACYIKGKFPINLLVRYCTLVSVIGKWHQLKLLVNYFQAVALTVDHFRR